MQPEAVSDVISELGLTSRQASEVEHLCAEHYEQFHSWLPRAARLMQQRGMDEEQIFSVLKARADFHSRHVPNEEIHDAINLILGTKMEARRDTTLSSSFKDLHWQQKLLLLSKSADWEPDFTVRDLVASSSLPLRELCTIDSRKMVELLFAGENSDDGLICVGKRKVHDSGFVNQTVSLRQFREEKVYRNFNLIVPNAPTKKFGFTKKGVRSQRALESFPNRRYVVLESDMGAGTFDIQARLIKFAGKVWSRDPVMVVWSGSRSLHAWFSVDGLPEDQIVGFVTEMKGLFDTATLRRNQFVRLPNGRRRSDVGDAETPQAVLYLNPRELGERVFS